MNKVMRFGMAAAMVAGGAMAQNDVVMVDQMGGSDDSAQVTAEAALVSAYVWRGQVYNDDFVIQPQLTIAKYGVSFNIWANYDLGKNNKGIDYDFSEIDLSLAYTLPFNLDDVTFDVGVISYNFPANSDRPAATAGLPGGVNSKSTTELFGAATLLTFKDYVIPSVTLFGDIDEANGVYILFDIVAPYEVSDYFAVEAGASAGWGNTSYNDYYWGSPSNGFSQDKGFNDFNFYGNASYEIMENLTASANVTYTFLSGGSIRSAASELYESDSKLWGGVNIAYDF